MKTDWLVWVGCVLLFIAGGIYFNMFPEIIWKRELGIGDVVSGVSAIAAAIAALAAWRAAKIAQRQSFDTALTTRWQMHKMHVDSFGAWLDSIEADQKIVFYRRHELYEAMFPCNRDPSLEFSDKGSVELKSWCDSFAIITDQAFAMKSLSSKEVESWVTDYAKLNDFLMYDFIPASEPQFYLDGRVPSGITVDKYEQAVKVMSAVLIGLSKFSFVSCNNLFKGISDDFKSSLHRFFYDVTAHGYNEHTYGVSPKDI